MAWNYKECNTKCTAQKCKDKQVYKECTENCNDNFLKNCKKAINIQTMSVPPDQYATVIQHGMATHHPAGSSQASKTPPSLDQIVAYIGQNQVSFLEEKLGNQYNNTFKITLREDGDKYFLYLKKGDTTAYQLSFSFDKPGSVYRDDFRRVRQSDALKATFLTEFYHKMMDHFSIHEQRLELVPSLVDGKVVSYNGKINWEAGYDFMWNNNSRESIYPIVKKFFREVCQMDDNTQITKELIKDTRILYYLSSEKHIQAIKKSYPAVFPTNRTATRIMNAAAAMKRSMGAPHRSAKIELGIPERGAENSTCWAQKLSSLHSPHLFR